jgi:hypothetical protein
LRLAGRGLYVLLATVAILATAAQAKVGPDSRVRVLYMGDAISTMYVTPYLFMRIEPMIQVTPVVASQIVAEASFGYEGYEMVRRAVRLYIPRNYRQLVEGQDVLILSDATLIVFTAAQIAMMARSVVDDGLGMVMAGGVESYHAGGWQVTDITKTLPVEMLPDSTGPGFGRVIEEDDELMRSIPWERGFSSINFGGSNRVVPRPGSVELARYVATGGGQNPMMVAGEVGNGSGFAFTPDWTWGWGGAFSQWEYYGDFTNNVMLYVAGAGVPQDIEILHAARKGLLNLDIARGLLVSLFEFVEKFGANPASIEGMLDDVEVLRREAEELYLGQRFSEALDKTLEAIEATEKAELEAIRLKNSALFWVYLIEWLVVTATLMISGIVAWNLMVRRRFFREVRSTRFVG